MPRSSSPSEAANLKNLDIQSRPSDKDKMNLQQSFYFEQSQEDEFSVNKATFKQQHNSTPNLPEETKLPMSNPSKFELKECDENSISEKTQNKEETPKRTHERPITMLR